MLKWVSNNSILERERQNNSSPRVETLRRTASVQYSVGPSDEKRDASKPQLVVTSDNDVQDDTMENLPLTPLKGNANRAISALSLEFPFSGRLSSPSIDSGVGSSKTSLITNVAKLGDSPFPFKTFDSILSYSPSNLSTSSNVSLTSRTYLSQLVDLVNMVITLPCLTRFPLAVAHNGGVAFVVAYTIVLVLIGFPSLYLQHNLARLEQKGPVQLWYSLVPVAGGLGTALASLSMLLSVQYSVITSYSMVYLISSFYTPLPWAQCSSWWSADSSCQVQTHNMTHHHSHTVSDFMTEVELSLNISLPEKHPSSEPSYQQFWYKHILQVDRDGGGATNTKLVWSLLGFWLLIAVTVLNWSKVVLTRLQGSLIILLVCLTAAFAIKLSTLPGISAVIYTTMKPIWSSLTTTACWQEAVLLSSICANIHTGTVQSVASYSSSRRDHSLVLVVCLAVHLLVCSVWSVLSLALAGDITRLDTELFPLAVLGQAISQVSGGQAWCQAWYSLTTTLGVMSVLSSLAAPLSYVQSRNKTTIRIILGLAIIVICLLLSLLCTFSTYPFILSLLTRWGIYFPSFLLGTVITITLSLTYGLSRATDRIAAQDGHKMHLFLLRYLQLTASLTPLVLAYFSLSFIPSTNLAIPSTNHSSWSVSLGWMVTVLIVGQLLIGAIMAIILSFRSRSQAVLSWRELLGCRSLRYSKEKLVDRSSLASSSYRNFERCDITMMTDLGSPSRLRPCGGAGLVNRRLSLSPRRERYSTE